jgi:hypothetical protein
MCTSGVYFAPPATDATCAVRVSRVRAPWPSLATSIWAIIVVIIFKMYSVKLVAIIPTTIVWRPGARVPSIGVLGPLETALEPSRASQMWPRKPREVPRRGVLRVIGRRLLEGGVSSVFKPGTPSRGHPRPGQCKSNY